MESNLAPIEKNLFDYREKEHNLFLGDEQQEEYTLLLRTLDFTEGFGIVFVICSPAQAERVIKVIEIDLPQKKVATIRLTESIDNLYNLIAAQNSTTKVDIVFIKGIEYSLKDYIKPGYGGKGDYYNLDIVPPILAHLNLQRNRLREDFSCCLVFLLPKFALRFFAYRTLDFFDWRSGVFELPTGVQLLETDVKELLDTCSLDTLDSKEINKRILEIESLISVDNINPEHKALLLFEEGRCLQQLKLYEQALACYRQSLELKSDSIAVLSCQGSTFFALGQYEEALNSYNKAIELTKQSNSEFSIKDKITSFELWKNKGDALIQLEHYEKAQDSYDRALDTEEYTSDNNYLGIAISLNKLANIYSSKNKYELAELLYKQALEIIEKVLGVEHIDVADILHNLAVLYTIVRTF